MRVLFDVLERKENILTAMLKVGKGGVEFGSAMWSGRVIIFLVLVLYTNFRQVHLPLGVSRPYSLTEVRTLAISLYFI